MLLVLCALPSLDGQDVARVCPVLSQRCAGACPAARHIVPGTLHCKNNQVFSSVGAIVRLSWAFNSACAGVRGEPLS